MRVDYNPSQLEVGKSVLSDIVSSIESLKTDVKTSFNAIKSTASSYKINLEGVINTDAIDADVASFEEDMSLTSELADTQAGYLDEYNRKSGSPYLQPSIDTEFSKKVKEARNKVHPDVATRVVATIGLGGFMFAEGFGSFFEGIGDAVITASSGAVSILGKLTGSDLLKNTANSWREFAKRDISKEFVENNAYFEKLNKDSYFDKNSVYANVMKGLGEAAAASLTTSFAVSRFASSLENGGRAAKLTEWVSNKVSSVSDYAGRFPLSDTAGHVKDAADKVTKALTTGKGNEVTDVAKYVVKHGMKGQKVIQKEVANVARNVEEGDGIAKALAEGTWETTVDQITDKASGKAGGALSNKFLENSAVDTTGGYVKKVGEAIENRYGAEARSRVSSATREVVGETVKNIAEPVVGQLNDGTSYLPVGAGDVAEEFVDNVISDIGANDAA